MNFMWCFSSMQFLGVWNRLSIGFIVCFSFFNADCLFKMSWLVLLPEPWNDKMTDMLTKNIWDQLDYAIRRRSCTSSPSTPPHIHPPSLCQKLRSLECLLYKEEEGSRAAVLLPTVAQEIRLHSLQLGSRFS